MLCKEMPSLPQPESKIGKRERKLGKGVSLQVTTPPDEADKVGKSEIIQLAHAEEMQAHSNGNYLPFAFFSDLPSTVL